MVEEVKSAIAAVRPDTSLVTAPCHQLADMAAVVEAEVASVEAMVEAMVVDVAWVVAEATSSATVVVDMVTWRATALRARSATTVRLTYLTTPPDANNSQVVNQVT